MTSVNDIIIVEFEHTSTTNHIGSEASIVPEIELEITTNTFVCDFEFFEFTCKLIGYIPAGALQFTFEIETALIVTTEFQNGSEAKANTRAIECGITYIELLIPEGVTRSGLTMTLTSLT